jgi:hypothetical protein
LFSSSSELLYPSAPFSEHTVETAAQRGWDKLKNGELLEAAEEAGFAVLVTPDKNIRYQQNLLLRRIALVVLGNPQWRILKVLSQAEYLCLKEAELRTFSTFVMSIYFVLMMYWWFPRGPRQAD